MLVLIFNYLIPTGATLLSAQSRAHQKLLITSNDEILTMAANPLAYFCFNATSCTAIHDIKIGYPAEKYSRASHCLTHKNVAAFTVKTLMGMALWTSSTPAAAVGELPTESGRAK